MSRKTRAAEFIEEGYQIDVTGRNVQVTEPMKAYAMEKILKIERFNIRIIDVNVTMDIQKLDHRVDIVLKVDRIKIKSHANSGDMYASVDMAVDKLQSQLRKYKDRIRDHQAKHTSTIDMNVNVLRRREEFDEEEIEFDLKKINGNIEEQLNESLIASYRPHEIVKKETLPLRVLTNQEAVMRMELSGDAFLIFRCEEDKKLKVMYRRKDGNFGVIETES